MSRPGASWSARPYLTLGFGAVGALFLGVFGWAASASVAGAVIASGAVVVDSDQKLIQHLEGGIVSEIYVDEGDRVSAGQVLLRLDDTVDQARLREVSARLDELRALQARLRAEAHGGDEIEPSAELAATLDDPAVAPIVESQREILQVRARSLLTQENVLRRQIDQLAVQRDGLTQQLQAVDRQIEILGEEVDDLQGLFDNGLVAESRLLALKREREDKRGERGRLTSDIAQAGIRATEAELQIEQLHTAFREDVLAQLRDTETQIQTLGEQQIAARDRLRRAELIAPQDGRVLALAVHTQGGVIRPGEVVMRLVPDDEYVVEVRVRPQDVDRLSPGQEAAVRFPAFDRNTTPRLVGVLERLSADRLTDQRDAAPYFVARVRISRGELARLNDQPLLAGMPADVYFRGADRTVLSYLLKPLTDQIAHTFREE